MPLYAIIVMNNDGDIIGVIDAGTNPEATERKLGELEDVQLERCIVNTVSDYLEIAAQ